MTNYKQRIGRWGEELAAKFLESQGYTLAERNARTPYGEIDLVALCAGQPPELVIFVEVKTRTTGGFGMPEEAVNGRKRQHLLHACEYYIQQHPELPGNWRIDVIAIRRLDGQPAEITHFENALS